MISHIYKLDVSEQSLASKNFCSQSIGKGFQHGSTTDCEQKFI